MPNANATYHLYPPTGQGMALMRLRANKLPTVRPSLSLYPPTLYVFLLILWRLVMYSESSWRSSAQPLADGWRKAGDEQSEWCISRKECSCCLSASAGAEVTHYCILIHLYCPLSERHYLREQQFLMWSSYQMLNAKTAMKELQFYFT